MEKRKVTISVGGQLCSFYSDDSDEYISALEQKTKEAMEQTAGFSGSSAYTHALLTVLLLADQLLRAEKRENRKAPVKAPMKTPGEGRGQVSVWDLLDEQTD